MRIEHWQFDLEIMSPLKAASRLRHTHVANFGRVHTPNPSARSGARTAKCVWNMINTESKMKEELNCDSFYPKFFFFELANRNADPPPPFPNLFSLSGHQPRTG